MGWDKRVSWTGLTVLMLIDVRRAQVTGWSVLCRQDEHQATVAGKAMCFGMRIHWSVLGLSGTRNCTCVPISVAVRVWADSPRFLGNGCASLVAWVGAGRRGKVVFGVVHLGWAGMVVIGLKGSLISLATRTLRKGC